MRFLIAAFALLALASGPLAAETVEGILIDKMCSKMVDMKGYEAAENHTKDCALMPNCQKSGFGVVTADGTFLKFDKAGDKKALEAIEGTDKEKNLTVEVDGKVDGENIKVKSLKLT